MATTDTTALTDRIAALQAEQQRIADDARKRVDALEAEKHATVERANLAIGERLGMIAILRELLTASAPEPATPADAEPEEATTAVATDAVATEAATDAA